MYTLNRPWHQSDVNNYLTCPTMFYLRSILELPEVGRHPNAVTGSCLHWAIEKWHTAKQPLWSHAKCDKFVADLFELTIQGQDPMTLMHSDGPPPPVTWEWGKDPREKLLEKAQQCFFEYTSQPHNIEAEVLHSEVYFKFRYWGIDFEGSIDQIRKCPDGSIELWDFKFSSFTPHREFLKRAIQFAIYEYGIWRGVLYRTDEEANPIKETAHVIGCIPDRCVWYHLPHLVPYAKNYKDKQKGDIKGDPRFIIEMPQHRLMSEMRNIRKIISQARRGVFFRAGKQAGACNGFCHYHDPCMNIIEGMPIDTPREATAEDFAELL